MFDSNNVDELISLDDFAVLVDESTEDSFFDNGGLTSRRLTHPEYGHIITVQSVMSSDVLILKI